MQVVLNNKILENKLYTLSNILNLQINEIVEKLLLKELNNFEKFSEIGFVDEKEEKEILEILSSFSKEDNELDFSSMKEINI